MGVGLGVFVAADEAAGGAVLHQHVVGVGKLARDLAQRVAHFDQVARVAVGVADEHARLAQHLRRCAALGRGGERISPSSLVSSRGVPIGF